MPHFDLSLDALRTYQPELTAPDDFDAFWEKTLVEAREHDLDARFEPVDVPYTAVDVFDVTYAGFGGHPVKGWLVLPAGANEPLPAVVEYIGYGGGRGLPHTHLRWAAAGFAHFVMDTRGQGSGGSVGDTPDPVGSTPSQPGFMTRGIQDPHEYYYRRVYTDAVRAVDAARSHPLVDASRVAVAGGSQGGGITIAVAGLVPDLRAAAPDVPFLCDFRRAATLTERHPYRGDRPLPQGPHRRGRARLPHALLLRRHQLRGACHGADPVLRRPGGPDLPAVHGLRRVQPLGGRREVDRGVHVQRPRGRRPLPAGRTTSLDSWALEGLNPAKVARGTLVHLRRSG